MTQAPPHAVDVEQAAAADRAETQQAPGSQQLLTLNTVTEWLPPSVSQSTPGKHRPREGCTGPLHLPRVPQSCRFLTLSLCNSAGASSAQVMWAGVF